MAGNPDRNTEKGISHGNNAVGDRIPAKPGEIRYPLGNALTHVFAVPKIEGVLDVPGTIAARVWYLDGGKVVLVTAMERPVRLIGQTTRENLLRGEDNRFAYVPYQPAITKETK